MKIRQLEDYQLKCFKKKYKIRSNSIILFLDDEKQEAYCLINMRVKYDVDYWYAVLYF